MPRRRKKHEDHTNHEAWAIPYGDLITLLLAFFVVMYAISSVNEGKFRVLSDSLTAAFNGPPKTVKPVQLGDRAPHDDADLQTSAIQKPSLEGQIQRTIAPVAVKEATTPPDHPIAKQLAHVANELETSLKSLVDMKLVSVRRHEFWLEVEMRSDILFASGQAILADKAIPALDELATTLVKYPNPVRVEGHTDNQPISTKLYPSNWELSAARAASVVHRFASAGVAPSRLSVIGFGENRPTHPNDTPANRAANRRVVIVILAGDGAPAPDDAAGMADEASKANQPAALPPIAVESGPAETTTENPVTPARPTTRGDGTESAPVPVTVGTGVGNPARE